MKIRILIVALGLVNAQAQVTVAPVLEAASIKLAPPSELDSIKAAGGMPGASFAGNRIIFSALNVASVIRFAYNLRVYQVSGGPSWINEDSYDIVAKAEGSSPLTVDQFRQLVQAVLADRFRLSVRHQTKEEPVYALVVGTKGFRLKESSSDQFSMKAGKTLIEVSAGTMAQLSATLSANVDRPVVKGRDSRENTISNWSFLLKTLLRTPRTRTDFHPFS
jgi:uncharacterized protein (TIGR03435 family)